MPRVIGILPVLGRRPLLTLTIQRLLEKNGCWKVICVGDDSDDEKVCRDAGAEWVRCGNSPLARKWNRGYHAAEMYDPDYYLYVGSSDWLSDNWIPAMIEQGKGADMIGMCSMYLFDHRPDFRRLCYWPGYNGVRAGETIGIGRLLSARIMERMMYSPFDGKLNNSLDWSMHNRVTMVEGKIVAVEDESVMSLSISDARWPNKHKFEEHWDGRLPSEKIFNCEDWLRKFFPEALML